MLRVAIVGCGISGPAAALFLKRLDAEITVFDKVEHLRPIGAGFLLQPAGLNVLDALGLASSLIQKGAPIAALHGINHKGKLVLDLRYSDLVDYHMGLGMHRAVLYAEFYKAIQAHDIHLVHPCQVIQIEERAEQIFLRDNLEHQHGPYDCVIIADGTHSKLRYCVHDHIKIKPYAWGALWSIFKDSSGHFQDILEQRYRSTGIMAGVLPIASEDQSPLCSFFWSLKLSNWVQWKCTPFHLWQEQILAFWPELESLFDACYTQDHFALATYSDIRMYPWHRDRIVVIGDAAHGMSPQLGQGANLSLIDAQVLFECMSHYPVKEAFKQYSQKRKAQINYYQAASHFVTPWFQSSSRTMGFMRDLLHGLFCKTPIIRQQMLLTLACMKTGYWTSMPLD